MEEKELFIKKYNLKQIEDFEDYYIRDNGEVYSYKNGWKTRKGWKKLTPYISRNGYENVTLVKQNKKKKAMVHRLVAKYFVDGYKEGLVVNHIDGNTLNNKADNLEWTTQQDNIIKGYETSGVDQTRNYHYYKLKLPNGEIYEEEFKGFTSFKEWFDQQNFPLSALTLRNKKTFKGFELIVFDK